MVMVAIDSLYWLPAIEGWLYLEWIVSFVEIHESLEYTRLKLLREL